MADNLEDRLAPFRGTPQYYAAQTLVEDLRTEQSRGDSFRRIVAEDTKYINELHADLRELLEAHAYLHDGTTPFCAGCNLVNRIRASLEEERQ